MNNKKDEELKKKDEDIWSTDLSNIGKTDL